MPQPAAIVEWWGPYINLHDVRSAVEDDGFEDRQQLLCLAHVQDPPASPHCRLLATWERRTTNGIVGFPLDVDGNIGAPADYYLGWIASYFAKWHRPAVTWALSEALRRHAGHDTTPSLQPPNADWHYCLSVLSWFYRAQGQCEKAVPAPDGFPTMVTYNSYEPEDMRLRVGNLPSPVPV